MAYKQSKSKFTLYTNIQLRLFKYLEKDREKLLKHSSVESSSSSIIIESSNPAIQKEVETTVLLSEDSGSSRSSGDERVESNKSEKKKRDYDYVATELNEKYENEIEKIT